MTPTRKVNTIAYLKNKTMSFSYTFGVLRSLEKRIRDEIQRLGGNQELEEILDTLQVEE
jgi:geranylgeranyl diphosphate synthase type 3